MELKHLRSFLAVARELSFGRAARALHLSQPALSMQIMTLEADVGVQLFERNRRMVRLTAAGESLRIDAEQLLELSTEAAKRASQVAVGNLGHLRLTFVASAAPELVPSIAIAFRKRYPHVTFELKNMNTIKQVEALTAGTVDAGFVRLPLTAPGLSIIALHSEPFAVVISKSHPLARGPFTLKQLANEPFVAYARQWAPEFNDAWTGICRRNGFSPHIVQETAEMDTALALVAAGMGVALVPEGLAKRQRKNLVVKSLIQEKTRSEIGIAILKSSDNIPVKNLLAIAKVVAGQ